MGVFFTLNFLHFLQFFTSDFIYICVELVSFHFSLLCKFYTISKFKRINNKSFHRVLLILSGDHSNKWNVFNSLLPKTDEI